MTHVDTLKNPDVPFPIFKISRNVARYMLYDIDVISWLRKVHNVLGVLIGTLPQIPQQNVFLSLPLELQPEEARLLVEKKLAFIVDDSTRHIDHVMQMDANQAQTIRGRVHQEGLKAAREHLAIKQNRSQQALEKVRQHRGISESTTGATPVGEESRGVEEILFDGTINGTDSKNSTHGVSQSSAADLVPWTFTSATSEAPVTDLKMHVLSELPKVNDASYALFAHLHSKGYFMTPGVRFGCQFSVYPGDPLRFHSHFLSMSYDWDEEIDLLDLVGGGRLGTGVKKGWLIGGPVAQETGAAEEEKPQVRTFCIEWGGM